MVEIKKLRVTKKLYRFEIKKKYQYVKHYRAKKEEPIDALKKKIDEILRPKKEEKVGAPPPSGFNLFIMIGAVALAIGAIFAVWLYLTIGALPAPTMVSKKFFEPQLNVSLVKAGIITSGDMRDDARIGYATLEITTKGIENINIGVTPYRERLPSEVFLLRSDRELIETTTYPEFVHSLKKLLLSKGLLLNEISLEELESLPKGAIVIVPSGSVPQELLGIDSNISFNKLLERGVVLVYIGKAFTSVLHKGIAVPTSKEVLAATGLVFDENTRLDVQDGFHLFQPLYRVSGSSAAIKNMENRLSFGFLSIVKGGDGALVFIPQTIDSGWKKNAELAASDVARIVIEMPWATAVDEPSLYETKPQNISESKLVGDCFSKQFKGGVKALKLEVKGIAVDGGLNERIITVNVEKDNKGDIYIKGGEVVIPTDISGENIRMNIKPRGPTPHQKYLFLTFTQGGEIVGDTVPVGSVGLQTETSVDIEVHLDSGEYIVHLVDDEGVEYAQSHMKVVSADVYYKGQPAPNKYEFSIEKEGKPITVSSVNVKVDGGKYGSYSFTDVSSPVIDVSKATDGEDLPPQAEPHIFTFEIGKLTKEVKVEKIKKRMLFEEPLFIGAIAISAVILAIGFYLARQEKVTYLIDIPDFPPLARTKIPLNKDTILSVFEKVNNDYKWQYTPLTVAEIKNGFKNVFYKGKPIYITDYNTEYLMNELIRKGYVSKYLDYYGPTNWEKKSGFSMKYLSMFRKLRDICVSNAVPFTTFSKEKEADSKITCMGQNMYVHIVDSKERYKDILEGALKTVTKGITILMFVNEGEKKEFEMLLGAASPALTTLKLEVEGSATLLQTPEEFEKMITELKEV